MLVPLPSQVNLHTARQGLRLVGMDTDHNEYVILHSVGCSEDQSTLPNFGSEFLQ